MKPLLTIGILLIVIPLALFPLLSGVLIRELLLIIAMSLGIVIIFHYALFTNPKSKQLF